MYEIIRKERLNDRVFRFVVAAPLIARSRQAGHFVVLRIGDKGERIPLTIADGDAAAGTITLVVQVVGHTTSLLAQMNEGDRLTNLVGPLGRATHIEKFGTVLCAGGGVGVAPLLPIVKALKGAGNRVVAVLAARSKDLIILEEEMRASADEVIIMTDDGSYGTQGMVTAGMSQVLAREKVDKCIAIGPAVMMKYCCLLTKEHNIPTDVSLNTIMVDGTGMCGACRVTVAGTTRFVCVDGPEFDGHKVDFDEMIQRLGAFRQEEQEALQRDACPSSAPTKAAPSPSVGDIYNNVSEETFAALVDYDAPWRKALRTALKGKERVAIARCTMPQLSAAYRQTTRTEEVNCGLSEEQARREAQRCLDCRTPTCVTGCPVSIDIPSFIKNIECGNYRGAARVLRATSALPAVCGRVCPQERQCESRCIHHKMNSQPVAIGYLERFAADYERQTGAGAAVAKAPYNGHKVAVVGSGPAGLSCAGDLAKKGYAVTVFEALHEIGGVLKYGIPEFRLPNAIVDDEIATLQRLGVTFHTDCVVGKTIPLLSLVEDDGYEAIFVATGAGLPTFMNIPGENAVGIMSSNEYLTRVNLMDASNPLSDTPLPSARRVLVVGGGNTAMDACRTARRLGAEEVFLAYRRSEEEMPARVEEVRHAKEEGITFLTLHNPLEYHCDEKGHVTEAVLQVMTLGDPDSSGRRRPLPLVGQTVTLAVDQVIVAVGVSPNPIVPTSVSGLELGKKSTIVVDDKMQSNIPVLFAGGDIVRGGATVILAMGDGRRAAAAIDEFITKGDNDDK